MKRVSKWMFLIFILIGLIWGGYRFNYPYPEDPYRIHNYPLNNVKKTLKQLEIDRIIFSAQITSWILVLTGLDTQLKKGIYEIDNRMGFYRITKMWLSGEQKVIEITIKEGDDLFDIGKTLFRVGILTNEMYWIELARSKKILDLVKQTLGFSSETKLYTLEGFLYPDTYYFFADNSPEEFIALALGEFLSRFQSILSSNLSDEYKLAVFKMASLVEKETSVPEEKPLIASVIYNRLKRKMKLRFDPTIIYTLKVTGDYYNNLKDGNINIKRKHYSIVSPYNTYYVKGLPITPISSFSLDSLEAVVNPSQTEYLFFVAKKKGKPQKGHYFSVNYEDHLRYINIMLER